MSALTILQSIKKSISLPISKRYWTLAVIPALVTIILFFYAATNSANVTSSDWMLHEEPFHVAASSGRSDHGFYAIWKYINPYCFESNGFLVYTIFGWLQRHNYNDIASFRFISSLFGFGTVALMIAIGKLATSSEPTKGWTTGVYASLWLATNICFAAFTSFGRFYAFNVFFGSLSLYFLLKAVLKRSSFCWVAYALAMVASVGSQLLSLSILGVHLFIVLYLASNKRDWLRFLQASLVPLAVFVLLFCANPREYYQFNRQEWAIDYLYNSLLFFGSSFKFEPRFFTNLSFPKAWNLDPQDGFWPQLPIMYCIALVSLIVGGYIVFIALRAAFKRNNVIHLERQQRVLHGSALGIVVLSALLLLFNYKCKPILGPVDICWFYPTFALMWGLILNKYTVLRWSWLISALLLPGHIWGYTYVMGTNYSRMINLFSDNRTVENIIVTNYENLPRDHFLDIKHVQQSFINDRIRPPKLNDLSDLAYLAPRYNYLAYTNSNSVYLIGSQFRALPYTHRQIYPPVFWIITHLSPEAKQMIQEQYLLDVLNYLQERGYCHYIKAQTMPIIWVNMRPFTKYQ